ncbi:DEAD/DEAH box helicase [Luteimonas sp. YGD11-2]|uniref:DEAD/DEAH box helicase n=1 Tax=Luteimonas sp. YGD11-2 TaxID=2508168 RepID=UPI00100C27B2|nr:DEAD/DEAH box helicase [Luteimonas sp. YGD11-2]
MAFKQPTPRTVAPDSPDLLFRDLPRRKHPSLYDHQGQTLRTYVAEGLAKPDVALQLPTGSGKTLVGLLLAEWRRRKFQEKVVYLCPTVQLVNQVVDEATNKYGISVQGFTGPANKYSAEAKASYNSAERVAVTTYSSIFNTRPFFAAPDIILLDDAHAAENYIATNWTLRISRHSDDEVDVGLFDAVSAVLKSALSSTSYRRLIGDLHAEDDGLWVDKLSTARLSDIAEELHAVVTANIGESKQRYPWQMISDHLVGCQLYVGVREILVRPLIPPTWTHSAFASAAQRIYMSATLGAGGDLERLTGRRSIHRLPIPAGWDRQGIGRRFFVFPGMSLDANELRALKLQMMRQARRAAVLVPSKRAAREVTEEIAQGIGFSVYTAADLERSRSAFTTQENSIAVIANRYDGIDFPNDDCRLLFIEGLPRATNLQERFFVNRMGAGLLLDERIQTRVFQAVGRCTRGLNDYSAVVVLGDDLSAYLADKKRRKFFHPELQAEIEFGVEQSTGIDKEAIVDNFAIFLRHDSEWEAANEGIIELRAGSIQEVRPAMQQLERIVKHEIEWQEAIWQGDYIAAYESSREILAALVDPLLRGYRALWHYLAGSSAKTAALNGGKSFSGDAIDQFRLAKEAAKGIPWLVALATEEGQVPSASDREQSAVMAQVENLEAHLLRLGTVQNRDFNSFEARVRDLLSDGKTFEEGQKLLGRHIGFEVGKEESDASPDPWWRVDDAVIIFEDHANAKGASTVIDATKARQAASHVEWARAFLNVPNEAEIIPVLVSPSSRAAPGALPSLSRVSYWELGAFRAWADTALIAIRDLRRTLPAGGADLLWRASAATALSSAKLDVISLMHWLRSQPADKLLRDEQ